MPTDNQEPTGMYYTPPQVLDRAAGTGAFTVKMAAVLSNPPYTDGVNTGALITAARAILAAVDYRCNGADRDVRVRDLWGAAYALKRIEQALQEL